MIRSEKLIQNYSAHHQFSGQIVIARDKDVIYEYTAGYSDYQQQLPFSNQQTFPIASITKQFTAAAILKLMECGKIRLDSPLSSYLNPNNALWQGNIPHWADRITIHHLLSNSSGLSNYLLDAILSN